MDSTLTLGCLQCRERVAFVRGLCHRCYDQLARRVRGGQTSWKKLEKAGRARPAGRSGWHGKGG